MGLAAPFECVELNLTHVRLALHYLILMQNVHKLNLWCGSDVRVGYINLDKFPQAGVDMVYDLEKLPLPFEDNGLDEIICRDILEHVEYIPLLKDLHRVLAPGGKLHVRVPHYTSRNNYVDPTHKKRFSISTFDYFAEGTYIWRKRRGEFFFDFAFSHLENRRINFDKSSSLFFRYRRLIEWFVNRSPRRQELYEMSGLSWRFPAADITITLVK